MSEATAPILAVFEAYKAAVFTKDAEAFAALYAPDVRIFDLWGQWSYSGAAAWHGMAGGWFGSLGTDRVGVDFAEIQITATPGLATAQAFTTFTGLSADGQKLRSMTNRLTWVLQPAAGAWKIIHEHTSAPVEHGTLKAMLQRAV